MVEKFIYLGRRRGGDSPKSLVCSTVFYSELGIKSKPKGNPYLGVMLPYTPLHHLLFAQMNGIPLVMTSGNRSHEPIAYLDDDAVDATEIDEILALRILTLGDEEKNQLRSGDERTRQILERTENLSEDHFRKLHGAIRGLRPLEHAGSKH